MPDISERITLLIKDLGISKKEFANSLDVSAGNVSDWCKGRSAPSYPSLKKIEKIFNVSLNWLNDGVGDIYIKEDSNKIRDYEPINAQEEKILNMFRALPDEEKTKIEGILEMKIFEMTQKTRSSMSISETNTTNKVV